MKRDTVVALWILVTLGTVIWSLLLAATTSTWPTWALAFAAGALLTLSLARRPHARAHATVGERDKARDP